MSTRTKATKATTNSTKATAPVVTTTTVDTALVVSAIERLVALDRRHRDEIRAARIETAPFVFAAFSDGTIGKGGALGTPAEVADRFGMTRANLTGLRSLGHCLSLGIDPNGRDRAAWSVLSDQANASWLTKVLSDKPTATKVRAAVVAYTKAKAAEPKGGRPAGKPDTTTATEPATKPDTVPVGRNNSTTLTSVEALLDHVNVSRLSAAERKRLQGIAAKVAEMLAHGAPAVAPTKVAAGQ